MHQDGGRLAHPPTCGMDPPESASVKRPRAAIAALADARICCGCVCAPVGKVWWTAGHCCWLRIYLPLRRPP